MATKKTKPQVPASQSDPPRHGRLKAFAAPKAQFAPSLKRDIVPFIAWA